MFDNVDDIDDSLSITSRFFFVDELDFAFDAAENDDGDIDEDEFVDDREDTVDGVESNDNVDDIDDSFFVDDELEDVFDAAENDDGDIDEDEFVDDREDTVDGVESNFCDTTTDEPTTLAMVFFFFSTLQTTYRILPSLGGFCCCSPSCDC